MLQLFWQLSKRVLYISKVHSQPGSCRPMQPDTQLWKL